MAQAALTGRPGPFIGTGARGKRHILPGTIDLETLLEIEPPTVKR